MHTSKSTTCTCILGTCHTECGERNMDCAKPDRIFDNRDGYSVIDKSVPC